jgi:hypothetical protein
MYLEKIVNIIGNATTKSEKTEKFVSENISKKFLKQKIFMGNSWYFDNNLKINYGIFGGNENNNSKILYTLKNLGG